MVVDAGLDSIVRTETSPVGIAVMTSKLLARFSSEASSGDSMLTIASKRANLF